MSSVHKTLELWFCVLQSHLQDQGDGYAETLEQLVRLTVPSPRFVRFHDACLSQLLSLQTSLQAG